jgi:uncharacterized glyoxalase superfamily protein PhnB
MIGLEERIKAISHCGGTKMMRPFLACGLLLALSLASYGDDKPGAKLPTSPSNAAMEKMKKLVGTWLVADKDGKPTDQVASIIKLTAGGSAVHETHFPGQPQEMVSIYTVDGPDLIMTHYCVIGNQPRMKADPNSSAGQIVFKFAGGANLDPKKDKHMHEATLTVPDDDHIEVQGTAWENGAPAKEMCCGLKLVRKKSKIRGETTTGTTITPYLFFGGRCEEALEFYRKSLGAEVDKVTRYDESPQPPPAGFLAAGFEKKIMHASFRVRGVPLMAADGRDDKSKSDGVWLALTLPTEAECRRAFDALADGGIVQMPLTKTFNSPGFGMVTDRFGLGWMITVPQAPAN